MEDKFFDDFLRGEPDPPEEKGPSDRFYDPKAWESPSSREEGEWCSFCGVSHKMNWMGDCEVAQLFRR